MQALTYLAEEDSYPSFERNEEDAFVSLHKPKPLPTSQEP